MFDFDDHEPVGPVTAQAPGVSFVSAQQKGIVSQQMQQAAAGSSPQPQQGEQIPAQAGQRAASGSPRLAADDPYPEVPEFGSPI